MSTRCGCRDDGDATVFGECRACKPEPEELLPGHDQTIGYLMSIHQEPDYEAEGRLYDHDLQEARIHQTLSPDELEG